MLFLILKYLKVSELMGRYFLYFFYHLKMDFSILNVAGQTFFHLYIWGFFKAIYFKGMYFLQCSHLPLDVYIIPILIKV